MGKCLLSVRVVFDTAETEGGVAELVFAVLRSWGVFLDFLHVWFGISSRLLFVVVCNELRLLNFWLCCGSGLRLFVN